MEKLFIEQLNVANQRVLVRVDFNVPMDENQNITNDKRIVAALPTIQYLAKNQAKTILMSHCGRPKGERKPEFSLKPVATELQKKLTGVTVKFVEDCIGASVEEAVNGLQPGEVLLLENLRYYKQEEKNDEDFAKQLASLGDLYINDAFGTAHRAHASTEGVTRYIDKCASGYLMKKELDYLGSAVDNPKRPFVAIIGGAKISGKIDVIKNLMDKVDTLIIGGGMTFTFYKAQGKEIGKSLVEEDKIELAKQLMETAAAQGKQLLLPPDCIAASEFSNDATTKVVADTAIPADMLGLDIGPDSVTLFADIVKAAKTIVWNGPMGVFEMPKFATGTNAVAQALAVATDNGATTIVGGGDSVSAVTKAGLSDRISHISTGGGASLEYLEGKTLPGVAALSDK
jgi:phosphoglycerate kinase